MNRKAKIFAFVAILLALGFFRESLFVNMNSVLYYKRYEPGREADYVQSLFRFLLPFSYNTLYVAKWLFTGVLVVAFWFLQQKFIAFLFDEKKFVVWLGMLYLSLLLLAVISFGTGWLIGYLDQGYRFSRIFMGLLQSPVPCMFLIPFAHFYKQNKENI